MSLIIPADIFDDLGVDVEFDRPLSKYTTFQLGGNAPCIVTCATPNQLIHTVRRLAEKRIPFMLMGGGSNLVVSDKGVDCVVIRYVTDELLVHQETCDLVVAASVSLDKLAEFAANNGLQGLNYTTGIPGTVGGAIVGNAGAFGRQVGDVLKSVVLLSPSGEEREKDAGALGFMYRYSNLRESNDIVVRARFGLQPDDKDELLQERDEILAVRAAKHPDLSVHPCAGSFFRNIEPTSKAGRRQAAGWFLDEAGGKKLSAGGARIFDKHANIIVKGQNCRAQDVYDLSRKMAALVKEAFQLELVREVKFVGRFDTPEYKDNILIW